MGFDVGERLIQLLLVFVDPRIARRPQRFADVGLGVIKTTEGELSQAQLGGGTRAMRQIVRLLELDTRGQIVARLAQFNSVTNQRVFLAVGGRARGRSGLRALGGDRGGPGAHPHQQQHERSIHHCSHGRCPQSSPCHCGAVKRSGAAHVCWARGFAL